MTVRPIRRALLSVWDKAGIVDLARFLVANGADLVSTGGTFAALQQAGLEVIDVASVTGSPEMLDGRVKTLHPAVHGAILARRDMTEHMATLALHGMEPIDLVVSNLYPFERTVASGAGFADCIEQIDIGGPAMTRAAAKNHDGVAIVTDTADYAGLTAEIAAQGGTTLAFRQRLAARAFAATAAYDATVSSWLAAQVGEAWPDRLAIAGTRKQTLRYGENPHQAAALYVTGEARPGVASARQVQGKELSYNNIADTDAAFELVAEFAGPAVAIIKHANPCGVALGADLAAAHAKALACDPVSAFGGIVAVNRRLDETAARAIAAVFTEVVIAPDADEAALAVFAAKKNLRLLLTGTMPEPATAGRTWRTVAGGLLVQGADTTVLDSLTTVSKRAPDHAELADLRFAFTVAKHVKSNAIVLARDGATVGIGAGQMSRVDSAHVAVRKAAEGPGAGRCVVASDAFFPFPDALEVTIAAGATAAIHPGGSMRDDIVTAAADAAGIAMVTTGLRHFRH